MLIWEESNCPDGPAHVAASSVRLDGHGYQYRIAPVDIGGKTQYAVDYRRDTPANGAREDVPYAIGEMIRSIHLAVSWRGAGDRVLFSSADRARRACQLAEDSAGRIGEWSNGGGR